MYQWHLRNVLEKQLTAGIYHRPGLWYLSITEYEYAVIRGKCIYGIKKKVHKTQAVVGLFDNVPSLCQNKIFFSCYFILRLYCRREKNLARLHFYLINLILIIKLKCLHSFRFEDSAFKSDVLVLTIEVHFFELFMHKVPNFLFH